jgi:tRNA(His) 5'-end guanylyltransferase
MSQTDKTTLGDRMKSYEQPTTSRKAFKGQPIIARLDGKSFHTFCKGLKRPFDERLSQLMVIVMKELVDRYQAVVGYTQSDEITLMWYTAADSQQDYPFDGRIQKLESLLAAFATAVFNKHLAEFLPEKADLLPIFDCRAFVVPNKQEAYHAFLWRQQDATKNAISMAAQSMFTHKSLQGLHGPEMQEKMWKEKGVNFNDYPPFFKRGTFARRAKVRRQMTDMDFERIPESYRPADGMIERTEIQAFDCWLSREEDPVAVLFDGQTPGIEKKAWVPGTGNFADSRESYLNHS